MKRQKERKVRERYETLTKKIQKDTKKIWKRYEKDTKKIRKRYGKGKLNEFFIILFFPYIHANKIWSQKANMRLNLLINDKSRLSLSRIGSASKNFKNKKWRENLNLFITRDGFEPSTILF
jgi:hypothetical protein